MKKIIGILIALMLTMSLGLATTPPVLAAITIHVPADYPTIQAAIDAASNGDTIVVATGEYDAFQVIGKANISIIGTDRTTVTTANNLSIGVEPIENAWVMAGVYDSDNIDIAGISFDGTAVSGQDVVGIAYVDSTGGITDLTVENIVGDAYGVGVAIIGFENTSTVALSGAVVRTSLTGIFVDGGGSILEAHFNKIIDNTLFGAYNYGDGTLDATQNWWGDASGPSGYGPGAGDAIGNNVNYVPWLEGVTATVSNGTVDAMDEADTEVVVTGTATVTVFRYQDNPGGDAPTGFIATGKYVDVYVPDTEAVTEIQIRLFYNSDEVATTYESYLRLLWWNGTEWVQCSDSGVNTADNYMWAKIRNATTPSLDDLQGDDFGGYLEPPTPPSGCFIATAAYGADTAGQLNILRAFRDDVLLHSNLGAKLVSLYYRTSPPIANFISQHEVLRTIVRVGVVDPIVRILTWTHDLW